MSSPAGNGKQAASQTWIVPYSQARTSPRPSATSHRYNGPFAVATPTHASNTPSASQRRSPAKFKALN